MNITRKHNSLNGILKTKKFKTLKCAPKSGNDYTCYSNQSLYKLRDKWNSRHPDDKIESNDLKTIWSSLKDRMQKICNTEACWMRKLFENNELDKNLLNYTFAPKTPKEWKTNPNEWLTSVDIEEVMQQYEKAYPSFEFIGPSPIDFNTKKLVGQCVWEELCNFNLKKYKDEGKTKIGIIFNTDPHYKDGSHWVSMFINLKEKYIFFYDSTGDESQPEIKVLVDEIIKQGKALGIQFNYIENRNPHQKLDTECGMYSLHLIINLLKENMKVSDFTNGPLITDSEMEKFRNIYFNPELN